MVFLQIVIAAFVLLFYYLYLKFKNSLWKRLGIYDLPGVPIFGNDARFVFGLESHVASQLRKYRSMGDRKYGGTHFIGFPFLFVKDPTMIETILVKDFVHFYDRGLPTNEKTDPLQANLLNMSGKRWKHLRNKLSPVFTSGKLKTMHGQIIDCADQLVEVLTNHADNNEPCDFRELFARFTTDVIGSCAYGLQVNCIKGENTRFREMGKKVFSVSTKEKLLSMFRIILRSIHPDLLKMLNLKVMSKEVDEFFINLVKDTVAVREKDPKLVRNDFIQLLINMRKEDDLNKDDKPSSDDVMLDDMVIAANAFLFFVAGFETTASAMSYCLFELSKDPDLQDRLLGDVQSAMSQHQNQPTYDAINNMPLLNMVINETLRKYPSAPSLLRISTEPYRLADSGVVLPAGTRVHIPIYSIHHDPAIYPRPEVFDPSRFSPENKDSIPKGAYLPFGDGPRICIGARFAQMEMKVALSKIITNFKIQKNPLMEDELEFDPRSVIVLQPKGGVWLDVERR